MSRSESRREHSAAYVLRDARGPWSQFRAYIAERMIGLAMSIDSRATFGLARELTKLEDGHHGR